MKLVVLEFLYKVWNSIANVFRRDRLEAELKIEMENHLHFQNEQNKRMGMSPEQARKEANINFGNPNRIEEDARDAWGYRVVRNLIRDIRFAFRLTSRYKSSSFLAVLMLGFGICIAIIGYTFSTIAIDPSLMGGFRIDESRQVVIGWDLGGFRGGGINSLDFQVFQEESQSLSELVGVQTKAAWFHLPGERSEGKKYKGAYATTNWLNILDTTPQVGRMFSRSNPSGEIPREVVISDMIWKDFFSRDEEAVGSILIVDDEEHMVVGVMPAGYSFPNFHQFWMAADWREFRGGKRSDAPRLLAIGLLKPERSVEQARAELDAIAARLAIAYPDTNEKLYRVRVTTVWDWLKKTSIALLMLFAISVFSMLLACTNVFNVIITRTASRSHELAVRICLGAKRSHVMWQVIIDGLVLSGFGAMLGVGFAGTALHFATDYLGRFPNFSMLHGLELTRGVVWASAGAAVFSGIAASFIPAWRASKIDAFEILKDNSRSSTCVFIGWLSKTIVISQVAITSVVLFAGLVFLVIIPTRWQQTIDLPYDVDSVLTASLQLSGSTQFKDSKSEDLETFYTGFNRKLLEVPGVQATAMASGENGLKGRRIDIQIAGWEDGQRFTVDLNIVTPSLLDVYGVEPVYGRMLSVFDTKDSERVCVVDTQFVKLHCLDTEPIGMRIKAPYGRRASEWITIVGVVPDLNLPLPLQSNRGGILLPYTQAPDWTPLILLRANEAGNQKIRQAVHLAINDLVPDAQIVEGVHTVRERIEFVYSAINGALTTGSIVGGSVLAMAVISLYSIIAFTTSLRRKEFGIRIAVGSSAFGIAKTVAKPWAITIALGLGIGYLCLMGLIALGFNQLGINQGQTMGQYAVFTLQIGKVYSWVCLLVCVCSLIGVGIPARKAMRINPMEVIRVE